MVRIVSVAAGKGGDSYDGCLIPSLHGGGSFDSYPHGRALLSIEHHKAAKKGMSSSSLASR